MMSWPDFNGDRPRPELGTPAASGESLDHMIVLGLLAAGIDATAITNLIDRLRTHAGKHVRVSCPSRGATRVRRNQICFGSRWPGIICG
jgi:hypothetical protein